MQKYWQLNLLYCIVHKRTTNINHTENQTTNGLHKTAQKNIKWQRRQSPAHNPVWTKHPVWIHTLRGPWHNKYLYGCYMFQCQDLTCSDSMKLPLQCILLILKPSLLREMKKSLIQNTNHIISKNKHSSLLSQYDFKWPGWSQVFTEVNDRNRFLVLTHCSCSHSFPSGNLEYKETLNSHSRKSSNSRFGQLRRIQKYFPACVLSLSSPFMNALTCLR